MTSYNDQVYKNTNFHWLARPLSTLLPGEMQFSMLIMKKLCFLDVNTVDMEMRMITFVMIPEFSHCSLVTLPTTVNLTCQIHV